MNVHARQVVARVTMAVLVVVLVVVCWLLLASPAVGSELLGNLITAAWVLFAVAVVIRVVVGGRKASVSVTARVAEPIEDLYSGRVRQEIEPRDPGEYSAHGTPPQSHSREEQWRPCWGDERWRREVVGLGRNPLRQDRRGLCVGSPIDIIPYSMDRGLRRGVFRMGWWGFIELGGVGEGFPAAARVGALKVDTAGE
ncbi:hypothetical protein [Glaciihabitans sp. dw_435]|uniref:hypothetical protein n=1 Tax=Glaciihabitans sp. dw_435 TaxID=2720081 RepID=UPI001BD1EDFB|nr:hypothetical protein [Glaciihabitans sp. dw_435]